MYACLGYAHGSLSLFPVTSLRYPGYRSVVMYSTFSPRAGCDWSVCEVREGALAHVVTAFMSSPRSVYLRLVDCEALVKPGPRWHYGSIWWGRKWMMISSIWILLRMAGL